MKLAELKLAAEFGKLDRVTVGKTNQGWVALVYVNSRDAGEALEVDRSRQNRVLVKYFKTLDTAAKELGSLGIGKIEVFTGES